jgi:quaternary ammonium compound-resistance protein SugE
MSWILLIIGGLFEVGFASCLGQNETKGMNLLIGCWAFLLCLSISMLLLYKATQNYLLV